MAIILSVTFVLFFGEVCDCLTFFVYCGLAFAFYFLLPGECHGFILFIHPSYFQVIPQAICTRYGLAVGANFVWLVRILMVVCYPIAYPIGKVTSPTVPEFHVSGVLTFNI